MADAARVVLTAKPIGAVAGIAFLLDRCPSRLGRTRHGWRLPAPSRAGSAPVSLTEPAQRRSAADDLVGELRALARQVGPNPGGWPGLTIYRYTSPVRPQWQEIRGLSIGIVGQGSKAVVERGRRHVYDALHYLAIGGHVRFQSEILEASAERPCLCLVLEVDPSTVRSIAEQMPAGRRPVAGAVNDETTCVVSAVDEEVLASVLRFLRALSTPSDRRVLAPLHFRELVYRVLQRDQFARMVDFAARQTAGNPVGAALWYIDTHLAEPLTVATLAAQVGLSSSAFSRAFRDATGLPPYQYVRDARLNRARELLVEGTLGVADVAHRVGYSSASHFIDGFRTRFGVTPGEYAGSSQRHGPDRGEPSRSTGRPDLP